LVDVPRSGRFTSLGPFPSIRMQPGCRFEAAKVVMVTKSSQRETPLKQVADVERRFARAGQELEILGERAVHPLWLMERGLVQIHLNPGHGISIFQRTTIQVLKQMALARSIVPEQGKGP